MPIEMTVERIIQRSMLCCGPEMPLAEAARRMGEAGCGSIVVVDGGRPVGIWTEHDALCADFASSQSFERPIGEAMSAPVRTIHGGTPLGEAGLRFQMEGIRHLVVIDESGAPIGVVSQSDVILRHGVEHFLVLRNIGNVLRRQTVFIGAAATLDEAVTKMRQARADAAVVLPEDDEGPGIVTERDIVRLIARGGGLPASIGLIASRPLVTVDEGDSLLAARNLLESKHIRHLGIMAGGKLAGLLTASDILAALQYEYVQRLDEALKQRDEALLRSRKDLHLARKVIEASLEGIMIVAANGLIEFVNPAFTQLTGYTPEEVIGKNPRILKSGRHDEEFYAALYEGLERDGYWQGEIWNRRKNGDIYPEWLSINSILDDVGNLTQYAAIFSDITERKKTEERIKNLAYFDVLTGLPNRRLFTDRLQVAIAGAHRHGHPLAIMFLDLDLFKRINDSLGHGIGDQVLVQTAERLASCLREGDTVARLGGDEFVVLLPEMAHVEDAAKMAERLILKVKEPFVVGDHELFVTTSVGIAVYPEDGTTVEMLIKNADTAMYRAKDLGRNSYQLYTPSMNARSYERLTMESHLRHALDREEFLLAYQVKLDLVSGRMSGVEALIRWHHPELGLIPPAEFIPLAEDMGLIGEIGAWVLKEACRRCKSWHDLGLPPVRIAVNVSALQFREADIPALVRATLAETGLEPRYLELELTESVLMQRVEEAVKVLMRLRELGVTISVDDFGTGYSSLTQLKRMPIDALKIDRSFVHDITDDGDGAEIVSTIINLAHNLKLKAVAEGVETPEQAEFLRRKGCDEIQGFLVSRPVSSEDLISLFDRDLLPGAQPD